MKNTFKNLPLIFVFALAITFTSCSDDDESTPTVLAPSISVSFLVEGVSATSAAPGDTIAFALSATADAGINRIYGSGLDINKNDLTLTNEGTSTSLSVAYVPIAADAGSTLEFLFIVVDDLNQVDSATVSLDIVAIDAKVQTAKLLYPPTGDGNSKTFYAISENVVYTHSDVTGTAEAVSPKIDLGYYYGGDDKATLSSISSYPTAVFDVSAWGTKNATKIIETSISVETYTALSTIPEVEEEFAKVDFTSEDGVTADLAVGNVLAFETVSGLKGFIYVSGLEAGSDSNDFIELEFILASE